MKNILKSVLRTLVSIFYKYIGKNIIVDLFVLTNNIYQINILNMKLNKTKRAT